MGYKKTRFTYIYNILEWWHVIHTNPIYIRSTFRCDGICDLSKLLARRRAGGLASISTSFRCTSATSGATPSLFKSYVTLMFIIVHPIPPPPQRIACGHLASMWLVMWQISTSPNPLLNIDLRWSTKLEAGGGWRKLAGWEEQGRVCLKSRRGQESGRRAGKEEEDEERKNRRKRKRKRRERRRETPASWRELLWKQRVQTRQTDSWPISSQWENSESQHEMIRIW